MRGKTESDDWNFVRRGGGKRGKKNRKREEK